MNSPVAPQSKPAWITPSAPPPLRNPPLQIESSQNETGQSRQDHPTRPARRIPKPTAPLGTDGVSEDKEVPANGPGPDAVQLERRKRGRRSRSLADRQPTPDTLRIEVWADPLLTQTVPATGFYAERYYAPIIGPTCFLLMRSLASRLGTDQEGFTIEAAELAASIGCSAKSGANSQFWKALRRGARFGIIRQTNDRVIVRTELGQLPIALTQRLPLELRREHRVWQGRVDLPTTELLKGVLPADALEPIEVLRLAARGLCTSEELRQLDRARKLR